MLRPRVAFDDSCKGVDWYFVDVGYDVARTINDQKESEKEEDLLARRSRRRKARPEGSWRIKAEPEESRKSWRTRRSCKAEPKKKGSSDRKLGHSKL